MTGTTCIKCGAPNRAGAKFCANCRAPLATPPAAQPQVPPRPAPQAPVQQTPRVPQGAPQQIPPRPPPRAPAPVQAKASGCAGWFKNKWVWIGASAVILVCMCLVLTFAFREKFPGQTQTNPTAQAQVTIIVATPVPSIVAPAPTMPQPTAQPSVVASPIPIQPIVPPLLTTTPTPTLTPRPTATLTPLPLPSPIPTDTPPNSLLAEGQSWRSVNQVMTLPTKKFAVGEKCDAILEFEMTFKNTGSSEVIINLRGADLSVSDNIGKKYDLFYWQGARPADCQTMQPVSALAKNVLDRNEDYKVSFQVRSKEPITAEKFYFDVAKAGRIVNAKWEIVVPR